MLERLKVPEGLDGDLWRYHPGAGNKMHHHAELEFNLITSGTGLYILKERKFEIRRGDLLWLFPEQEHVLIQETGQFEMWVGYLKPGAAKRIASDRSEKVLCESNPSGQFCRRLEQDNFYALDSLINTVASKITHHSLFNAGLGYVVLSAWHLFQSAADIPASDLHPAVENAARLIRNHDSRLSLTELAQQAGLSAPRLSRLFKQQTGQPLAEFRNRHRVNQFLKIYSTGQRVTMLTAALEAGFGSYPQFHRVFTRLMGKSPQAYRRSLGPEA